MSVNEKKNSKQKKKTFERQGNESSLQIESQLNQLSGVLSKSEATNEQLVNDLKESQLKLSKSLDEFNRAQVVRGDEN